MNIYLPAILGFTKGLTHSQMTHQEFVVLDTFLGRDPGVTSGQVAAAKRPAVCIHLRKTPLRNAAAVRHLDWEDP